MNGADVAVGIVIGMVVGVLLAVMDRAYRVPPAPALEELQAVAEQLVDAVQDALDWEDGIGSTTWATAHRSLVEALQQARQIGIEPAPGEETREPSGAAPAEGWRL